MYIYIYTAISPLSHDSFPASLLHPNASLLSYSHSQTILFFDMLFICIFMRPGSAVWGTPLFSCNRSSLLQNEYWHAGCFAANFVAVGWRAVIELLFESITKACGSMRCEDLATAECLREESKSLSSFLMSVSPPVLRSHAFCVRRPAGEMSLLYLQRWAVMKYIYLSIVLTVSTLFEYLYLIWVLFFSGNVWL